MNEICSISVISFASFIAPSLEIHSAKQEDEIVYVWEANIIKILSEAFRVPYKLLIPDDGRYGEPLPDGNWTGLIGMVKRSEVDLALGGVIYTEKRSQAVNFSHPYFFSEMTFMTDMQKPLSTNLALLYPFSLVLWILIMTVISLISLLIYILTKRKETFQSVLFRIFGSLLEKSFSFKTKKRSLVLLLGTWLIFITIVTNSYKALLLSFLSFRPVTGIRNIADLARGAEQNSVACYTYNGSALPQVLLESDFDTWRSIGKCLKKYVITSANAYNFFVEAPPNKAIIGEKIYLDEYEKHYHISENSFFNLMWAIPMSKNFACPKHLNKIIRHLFEAGVFSKCSKDEIFQFELRFFTFNIVEKDNYRTLQIVDFQGAFLVLIFGYILAFVTLLIEIAIKLHLSN